MTPHIRIAHVAVYSLDGKACRTINLQPGLNVITGPSSRGKSSILDIIDYCLLSKHCRIPKGVIRNCVGSVATEFIRSDGQRLALIRPLPTDGQITRSEVAVLRANGPVLPKTAPNGWDWNLNTAKEALSDFTGIEAASVLTPTKDGQIPPSVNIRHATPFLFQPQDVIASRNIAFSGLTDGFAKLHFSDASYYFLGLLTMDFIAGREELERLRAELQMLRRQVIHEESLRSRSLADVNRVISEAKALGLGHVDGVHDVHDARKILTTIAKAKIVSPADATATASVHQQQEVEANARAEVDSIRRDLAGVIRAIDFLMAAEGARSRLRERLGFADIVPDQSEIVNCPLCKQGVIDAAEERRMIGAATEGFDNLQRRSSRRTVELQREANSLQKKLDIAQTKLADAQRTLSYLFRRTSDHQTMIEEWQRRERLIGRATNLLMLIQSDDTERKQRIEELHASVHRLEDSYGPRRVRELKKQAEEALADTIAKVSRKLSVEFPGVPVRINFEDNIIELQLDDQWIPLSEIGSGANWVGYHVASLVALHDFFAEKNSPVPRFIAFDQPSQAWFPPEEAKSGARVPSGKGELEAVRRVFRELFCLGLRGVQVIVADHASLSDDWFKESIRENWHEGGGLVPENW